VQEQYEQTDDFHERWRVKARDFIARGAWRRQKLAKRVSGLMCVVLCVYLPECMHPTNGLSCLLRGLVSPTGR
jgi:hypothetical protein